VVSRGGRSGAASFIKMMRFLQILYQLLYKLFAAPLRPPREIYVVAGVQVSEINNLKNSSQQPV
jgi:hypothetical protein